MDPACSAQNLSAAIVPSAPLAVPAILLIIAPSLPPIYTGSPGFKSCECDVQPSTLAE